MLPRDVVARALASPITERIVVTDAGSFPTARGHSIEREHGASSAIVLLCTSGEGWVRADGVGERRIAAGDAVYLPARRRHAYGAVDRTPWSLHWLHVAGKDVPSLATRLGPSAAVRRIGGGTRETRLVDEILDLLSADLRESSLTASAGAAWHLMASISAAPASTQIRSSSLEELAEILRTSPEMRFSISEMARMCGFSPSHFQAKFTEAVGMPALTYHLTMRMAIARRLLDESGLSIANVAERAGYADAAFFSRQFAKIHGLSPREYRAQVKG